MGLLSKKKRVTVSKFETLIEKPLEKKKFGNSSKLKTETEISFTRKMIQNHFDGNDNTSNMNLLINDANNIFNKPLLKMKFPNKLNTYTTKFNEDKFIKHIQNKIPNFSKLVNYYIVPYNLLYDEYILSKQISNYSFITKRGMIDNYIIELTSIGNIKIISEYNPNNLMNVPHNFNVVIGDEYGISKLGLSTNIEEIEREIKDKIESTTLSTFALTSHGSEISYYYNSYKFINYNIFVDVLEIDVRVTWKGHTTQSIDTSGNKHIVPKYETLHIEVQVPKFFKKVQFLIGSDNLVWIAYINTNNEREIKYIIKSNMYIEKTKLSFKASSTLPLKGKEVKADDKRYKKILMNLGYLENKKKAKENNNNNSTSANNTKVQKEDFFSQLQNNKLVKDFYVRMVIDLRYFMLKDIREDKYWQKYLLAFFKFFEKYVSISSDISNAIGSVIEIQNTDSKYRIKMAKKYVKDRQIKKKCFLSVEPNHYKTCLYLNVPDYTRSTPEEKAKGIYKDYIQYILDYAYFFDENYNGYDKDSFIRVSLRPNIVNGYKYQKLYLVRFVSMENADLDFYKKTYGVEWVNEGDPLYIHISNISYDKDSKKYSYSRVYKNSESFLTHFNEKLYYQDYFPGLMGVGNVGGIFPLQDLDEIVDWLNPSKDDKSAKLDTKYLTKYIPPIPLQLWYKIPYNVKLKVYPCLIVGIYTLTWVEKRSTFLGKIFGLVLVIVGAILSQYGGAFLSKLGTSLILSGVGYQLNMIDPRLGLIFAVVTLAYGLYTGLTDPSGFIHSLGNNAVEIAKNLIGYVSQANNIILNVLTIKDTRELKRYLNDLKEKKKKYDKEIEKSDRFRVMKLNSSINDPYSDIDLYYNTSYGEALYSDLAYESLFDVHQSYELY